MATTDPGISTPEASSEVGRHLRALRKSKGLSRTEVAVISAGVKSILDIARTLEVLETLGVPVVGYGTDEFPSFFSRSSGVRAPMRLDTPEEVAALMDASRSCGASTVGLPP